MQYTISYYVNALRKAVNNGEVDWQKLRSVLLDIEDINMIDLEDEETILSCFIGEADFYRCGINVPKVIQTFIDCGYNVKANGGKNGDYPLYQICWSCYDKYILDAAKTLLNAGSKVILPTGNEEDDCEVEGIIGALNWKIPGAWVVYKDFTWANNLEALYNLVHYAADGKDYNLIESFEECIGSKLTAVYALNGDYSLTANGVSSFAKRAVFVFENKPLVVSNFIDFSIDPIFVSENSERLCDISLYFKDILGKTLKEIVFVDSCICSFEFNGNNRILFSALNDGTHTNGIFEIRQDASPEIRDLYKTQLYGIMGKSYASYVTDYEEKSIAAIGERKSLILFSHPNGKDCQKSIKAIYCSKELISMYTRKLPFDNIENITSFSQEEKVVALRLKYKEGFLYIKATECEEIEIKLSNEEFNPCDLSLCCKDGKHFEFIN